MPWICDAYHAAKQHIGLGCLQSKPRDGVASEHERVAGQQQYDTAAPTEVKIVEMSWLETVEFIGLDLQAGLILALLALDLLQGALHSAWSALSQRVNTGRVRPVEAPRSATGLILPV